MLPPEQLILTHFAAQLLQKDNCGEQEREETKHLYEPFQVLIFLQDYTHLIFLRTKLNMVQAHDHIDIQHRPGRSLNEAVHQHCESKETVDKQ